MSRKRAVWRERFQRAAWPLATSSATLAWLWPIGLGGKTPIGGDATQFSLGLLAVLAHALRERTLPAWNALWGYGFPGLAESQMGVYYPPNWIFYGCFPLELGATLSLCLHALLASLGAYWAARKFGANRPGAFVSGVSFVGCGFFLIHLAHHWAFVTASWLPWALGLTWSVLREEKSAARSRDAWRLSAVLALQILPGHFQLAFETQICVLIVILWSFLEKPRRPLGPRFALISAWAFAFVLTAAQIAPTARLARLAGLNRGEDYLSGFATPPPHLISYIAPELFHRSQLWRPVVWDTFHASPEEHLGYVGLVPLFLATATILRSLRRDPSTRILTILAIASLLLSIGPFLPGFRWYSQLPGFSFFRAPARWGVATAFCLAILAGKGFAILDEPRRVGRALAIFAVGSAALIALASGLLAYLIEAGDPRETHVFFDAFARQVWPWPDPPSLQTIAAQSRARQGTNLSVWQDLRVQTAHARERLGPFPIRGESLRERFPALCVLELSETAALLIGLLAVAAIGRDPNRLKVGCLALILLDFMMFGRHRLVDLGPIEAAKAGSPVLEGLAERPGSRVIGPLGNLPMAVGAAPLPAYRTLDLPVRPDPAAPALTDWLDPSRLIEAMEASGAAVRLFDPVETGLLERVGAERWKRFVEARGGSIQFEEDSKLAAWLLGADLVAANRRELSKFAIVRLKKQPAIAWELDRGSAAEPLARGARAAKPLRSEAGEAGRLTVFAPASRSGLSKRTIGIARLFDEPWRATWVDSKGKSTAAEVYRRADGLQGVVPPSANAGELRLEYRDWTIPLGLGISSIGWLIWLVVGFAIGREGKNENRFKE